MQKYRQNLVDNEMNIILLYVVVLLKPNQYEARTYKTRKVYQAHVLMVSCQINISAILHSNSYLRCKTQLPYLMVPSLVATPARKTR